MRLLLTIAVLAFATAARAQCVYPSNVETLYKYKAAADLTKQRAAVTMQFTAVGAYDDWSNPLHVEFQSTAGDTWAALDSCVLAPVKPGLWRCEDDSSKAVLHISQGLVHLRLSFQNARMVQPLYASAFMTLSALFCDPLDGEVPYLTPQTVWRRSSAKVIGQWPPVP